MNQSLFYLLWSHGFMSLEGNHSDDLYKISRSRDKFQIWNLCSGEISEYWGTVTVDDHCVTVSNGDDSARFEMVKLPSQIKLGRI